ncbi:sugar transferase [Bifidobacterium sp. 82T24]|uniref:sugar transferase n=1 Tax=Bifidobacterium pluvialisilvae TaxID=2834436 RepID=UPI001C559D1D|nr:sugar transferase [Bifidobacterium pluvialisilvae]MBW3087474.1 sugar transferase [Bifidobacterium pluvialisilvae]
MKQDRQRYLRDRSQSPNTSPASASGTSDGNVAVAETAPDVRYCNPMELTGARQASQVLYWRFFVNLVLMVVDGSMLVFANLIMFAYEPFSYMPDDDGMVSELLAGMLMVLCALIYVACLHSAGIYHRHIMGDGYQVNYRIVEGVVKLLVVQAAFNYVAGLPLPLHIMAASAALTLAFTVAARFVARRVIVRRRGDGRFAYATIVIGSPACIARTLGRLRERTQMNYRPVAVCPIGIDPKTKTVMSMPIPADVDIDDGLTVLPYNANLGVVAVDMNVQTLLICDVIRRDSVEFNVLSLAVESLGIEIALSAGAADMGAHRLYLRNIQGMPVLTLRLPQYGFGTRMVKRGLDLVLATLAIIVASPIMAATAIAIKLDDGGPVFYGQRRIGLRGKPFHMIKFRSMVTNADELKAKLAEETGQTDRFIFKMKRDPRITRVGSFIRKWSIDELPQFLNVLRGDMSVVGPRPPLPEEHARYNRLYATRMYVKPGITGPWQVSGRSNLTAEESEQLDVSYVQDWSITGDLTILFKTIGVVITHKGAY